MFLSFKTDDDRRKYGGSAFIELQYCNLPADSDINQLVSVDNIINWKADSLYIYIDDDNSFVEEYGHIFTGGTYNNLKTGPVDICGINYYSPQQVTEIVRIIKADKPLDYSTILPWLQKSEQNNGIYIL